MTKHFIDKIASDHYLIDITDNIPLIVSFNSFIKFHPEFYQQKVNHRIIVAENLVSPNSALDERPDVCIIYDEPVKFDDKIHNTSGYIITDYTLENLPNNTTKQHYTFKIWIKKNESGHIDPLYHIQVQEYMKRQARHGNRVQLYYYKILNEQLITHNFYDRKLADWIDDVKQLREEFFSPHKRYLFDVMTQSNRNGNWSNLILHGEPGTGKSSFVFRLATQLKMSIISVDLSMYIDRKRDLYSIFHGNEFNLPHGKGPKLTVSQNCIIILEEFDSSIEKIKQLENIFQFKSDTIYSYVSNKTSEIGKKVQDAIVDFVQPDVPLSDPYQYLNARQNSGNNGLDPLKITNEIYDIVRTITEDNKSDILRLRDLLELFQGPVPVRDRIIVATTNNFEQIKNIIPPLFRPGRLTPIKFTYLDWVSLQELCLHYFSCELNIDPFEIVIPTSQITELSIKYVSMSKAMASSITELFEDFIQELIELNIVRREAIKHETIAAAEHAALSKTINLSNYMSTADTSISSNTKPVSVVDTSISTIPKPAVDKVDMYAKWIDQKLGYTNTQPSSTISEQGKRQLYVETKDPARATVRQPRQLTLQTQQPQTQQPQTQQPQPKQLPGRQIQRRPVVKSQQAVKQAVQGGAPCEDEDERIRSMAIDKVMAKDRNISNKLPGYNKEELVNDYLQTAVLTPQHDDDY
jgi:hypothetical protein